MKKKATVNWIEGYRLEGITSNNLSVMMDTGENAIAPSPAQLILQALAGCTMMDCVLIITKARKKLEKFWIDVETEEAETHPKVYTKIHLIYNFVSPDLDAATAERAINLSEEKYCRVHAMLVKSAELSSSYKINPKS